MPSPLAAFHVLANPAYRTWAAADLVSVCGSWMQTVALSWLVYAMTGSTAMLGLTLTLSSLPSLVLSAWPPGRAPTRPCDAPLLD